MLLSPAERILLFNILPPAEGSVLLLRGVRRLRKELAFSDQEIQEWHVVIDGPSYKWDGDERVLFEWTPAVNDYVGACLQKTEAAGKLHEALLPLYDQFFPEEV